MRHPFISILVELLNMKGGLGVWGVMFCHTAQVELFH